MGASGSPTGPESADHLVEQLGHTLAGLAGHQAAHRTAATDDVGELAGVPLGVGGGRSILLSTGMTVRIPVECQVQVRQRLASIPLRGIDQQHLHPAGLERTRHS